MISDKFYLQEQIKQLQARIQALEAEVMVLRAQVEVREKEHLAGLSLAQFWRKALPSSLASSFRETPFRKTALKK